MEGEDNASGATDATAAVTRFSSASSPHRFANAALNFCSFLLLFLLLVCDVDTPWRTALIWTLPLLLLLLIGPLLRPALLTSVLLSSFLLPSPLSIGVSAGEHCVFPSRRDSVDKSDPVLIDQCTWNPVGRYWWCPTTADYEKDKLWRKCPETAVTYAGNRPGSECKIPFQYDGQLRHACIKYKGDSDQPYSWCATTNNYDRDQLWTKCKPDSKAMPCHFDSRQQGVYNQCDRVGDKWFCTTHLSKLRECPETPNTYGGNDPGQECAVPFSYKKEENYQCIDGMRENDGPYKWCATTPNYDVDKLWTRCKDGDMHKGLRYVIRIIIIAGGSLGGVIVVGCVLYYACDPVSLLQMTLRKRKPRPTNEVQLQTEDDFQCERNPLTPTAPPPPSYDEVVSDHVQTAGGLLNAPHLSDAPV